MRTNDGLFDEPGPRGRLIIRVISAVALLAIVGLVYLGVVQFKSHGQLDASKWSMFVTWADDKFLLNGWLATLRSALVALAGTLAFGLLLALGRLSRRRWLRILAGAYVEIFRSIPTLIVVLIFLLILPSHGIDLSVYWQLTGALIVAHSAKVAEVYRAGILSMERGQMEAALSLGLNYTRAMRVIVLPQALRRLAPALVSEVVAMLKSTSLGYFVSYSELLFSGKILGEYTENLVQAYVGMAVIYIVMNGTLSWISRRMEARQGRRRHRIKVRLRPRNTVARTAS